VSVKCVSNDQPMGLERPYRGSLRYASLSIRQFVHRFEACGPKLSRTGRCARLRGTFNDTEALVFFRASNLRMRRLTPAARLEGDIVTVYFQTTIEVVG
jgi:hypothetical protein